MNFEKINNSNEEGREERAKKIMTLLGLTLEELQGKKVLDLGAGEAELAESLSAKGVDIFSLDIKSPISRRESFILAKA